MILNALREATRPLHDKLDHCMPVTDPGLTLEGYANILKNFYGIYAPLEAQLMGLAPWLNALPDYPDRLRLPMLDQDLDALGIDQAQRMDLPRHVLPDMEQLHHQFAEVSGLHTVFGVMYVMEGSTLGGQHLVKHLQNHFAWQENQHCDFFNSYCNQVGPRWKLFCNTLEDFAREQTLDEQNKIVQAAVNTFTELEHWFTQQNNLYSKELAKIV